MALRKAIAWSVGGQTLSYLILFLASVVVARLLTPRDMGIFAATMALVGILNTLAAFGVATYVIRAKDFKQSTLDSAFTINAMLSCAVALAILLASFLAGRYFNSPDVARALVPLSISAVISIFEFRPVTVLQREMQFKQVAVIQTAKALISNTITITLAILGYSYMSLPYGNVAFALSGVVAANLLVRQHISVRLSMAEARAITSFGLQMMSITGIGMVVRRASDLILGNMMGLVTLGLYSRASSIATLIIDNAYTAVTRVLFVRLSEEHRTKGTVRDVFIASFEILTALLWPVQLGLAVLAGPAIYYLYGARWVGASLPLSILMIAQCVSLSLAMNWELFVLKGETARQTKMEFTIACVGMAFFVIGCMFNIVAAAGARLAEAFFGFTLYHRHMVRLSEARHGQVPKILARNAVLALVAVVPSFVLMLVERWSYQTPLYWIAAAVMTGILCWYLLLQKMTHPLGAEINQALGLRIRK
jgi:O-antigen/teichoic acid export membrane protein